MHSNIINNPPEVGTNYLFFVSVYVQKILWQFKWVILLNSSHAEQDLNPSHSADFFVVPWYSSNTNYIFTHLQAIKSFTPLSYYFLWRVIGPGKVSDCMCSHPRSSLQLYKVLFLIYYLILKISRKTVALQMREIRLTIGCSDSFH